MYSRDCSWYNSNERFGICMGIITNDQYGIQDEELYELLLEQFGNGVFGKKLREEALYEVKELTIVNTGIRDLSFLRFFPNLIQLDVHANQLVSLLGLGFVHNLRRLKLSDNPVLAISALRDASYLEVLDISNCRISDISPIGHLQHLQFLRASNCSIQNTEALAGLQNLTLLIADHNQINEVNFVRHLDQLNELDLGHNEIESSFPLLRLPNLTRINLEFNKLTTLRGFDTMEELCYLNVRGNQLNEDLNIWYDTLFYIEQLVLCDEDYYFLFEDGYETSLYEYRKEEEKEGKQKHEIFGKRLPHRRKL